MSTTATPESAVAESVPEVETVSPLRRRALVALSLALAAAVATRLLAVAALGPVANSFDPLALAPLAISAAAAAVGATLVYAALDRLVARPERAFLAVAAVVLAASFLPVALVAPTLPGATVGALALLGLAHVLVAAGVVGGLTDRIA